MSKGCNWHERKTLKWVQNLFVLFSFIVMPLLVNAQEQYCGVKVKDKDIEKYNKALACYHRKDYKQSAMLLRQVATRNSHNADIQYWLGMNAVADGFNVTAIRRYFTQCIALCHDYPKAIAHYYMALIHYTDRHYEEAVSELETYFSLANNTNDATTLALYNDASNYLYWSQFLADANLNLSPYDPQIVAGVSSSHDEMLPFITLDDSNAYYLRLLPEKQPPTFYARENVKKQWHLCHSTLRDGSFSKGTPLPYPFNQGLSEGGVSITADGNELYYSIIKPENGYNNSDIYCVRRIGGVWQEPINLGTNINGSRSWESQPSITPDGKTLYFASNRQGGQGGIDIWRSHRLDNGTWSRAENLGPSVNTKGNEKYPFIHADGYTLFFVSDHWQGFGGYDTYFTNILDRHAMRPTNLGLPINSENDETSFGVRADGRQAYICSRTEQSVSNDILLFDLYPAARPEPMRHTVLTIVNAHERFTITVARLDIPMAVYSVENSNIAEVMLSTRYDNIVTITAEGCFPQVLVITTDMLKRSRRQPLPTLQVQPLSLGDTLDVSLSFDNTNNPTEQCLQLLDVYTSFLVDNPRLNLHILCSNTAQCKAVYNYFIRRKIRPNRLSYTSMHGNITPKFILL